LKYEYELKVNFVNSSQNEGLSPSGIALSFKGLAQFHGTLFGFHLTALSVFTFFFISNFFNLSITEETRVVEMRIWCIKISNILVLHLPTKSPPNKMPLPRSGVT
jgi:hypothetical protein